jgi:hypothetical protein
MSEPTQLDKLVEDCPYETKLAVTAWVFRNIVEHAQQGGSFRFLIYGRLGFDTDAYVPLYEAGGMEISNEFDLGQIPAIIDIVKEHKFTPLKNLLNLCDEPDCFHEVSCGFPTDNGYRHTCSKHSNFAKDKNGT